MNKIMTQLRDGAIVAGDLIAPGLAVVELTDGEGWTLVHIASGDRVGKVMCERHVRTAGAAAIASGIAWMDPAGYIVGEPGWDPLRVELAAIPCLAPKTAVR